jgi:hypothetical protein
MTLDGKDSPFLRPSGHEEGLDKGHDALLERVMDVNVSFEGEANTRKGLVETTANAIMKAVVDENGTKVLWITHLVGFFEARWEFACHFHDAVDQIAGELQPQIRPVPENGKFAMPAIFEEPLSGKCDEFGSLLSKDVIWDDEGVAVTALKVSFYGSVDIGTLLVFQHSNLLNLLLGNGVRIEVDFGGLLKQLLHSLLILHRGLNVEESTGSSICEKY